MKRYTQHPAGMLDQSDGEYVLHSDHEVALAEAVSKRDDLWATAISERASFATCQAICAELEARVAP